MSKYSKFAAHVAGLAVAVTFVSASVFAESRPSRGTARNDDRGAFERRDRNDRNDRNDRGRNDRYDRNDRRDRGRQVQYFSGRVSRYDRYRDGYRVWLGGVRYPFYVPSSHWRDSRFRVGIDIRLGGYYNPGGYYDYYDERYDDRSYSRRELSGRVEDVDYRRGTFLVREDRSQHVVTVVMRGRDRFFDDLRRGDYVELDGSWNRGVFEAYRIEDID
jgi:hypothetical protein